VELPSTSTAAGWVALADSPEDAAVLTRLLTSGRGERIQWRLFGPLTFDPRSEQMVSDTNALRASYRAAGGGTTADFVGYATNGVTSGGVRRAQNAIDALSPAAVLSATGRVDLVTNPPLSRLVPGTEGSVFVVSWREEVVETTCVDARFLFLDKLEEPTRSNVAEAIRAGDGPTVDTAVDVTVDLGEVQVQNGIPASGDVSRTVSELRAHYSDNFDVMGWFDSSLDDAGQRAAIDRIKRVLEAIDADWGPPITVHDIVAARFASNCRARIIAIKPFG
jgi:hypothetical protein